LDENLRKMKAISAFEATSLVPLWDGQLARSA
jgi:hypothetical protein